MRAFLRKLFLFLLRSATKAVIFSTSCLTALSEKVLTPCYGQFLACNDQTRLVTLQRDAVNDTAIEVGSQSVVCARLSGQKRDQFEN